MKNFGLDIVMLLLVDILQDAILDYAVDGFGNMMYFGGSWTTLIAQNPDLDYNWNIQGFVGWAAPTNAPSLESIKIVLKETKSLSPPILNPLIRTQRTQTVRSTNDGSSDGLSGMAFYCKVRRPMKVLGLL